VAIPVSFRKHIRHYDTVLNNKSGLEGYSIRNLRVSVPPWPIIWQRENCCRFPQLGFSDDAAVLLQKK